MAIVVIKGIIYFSHGALHGFQKAREVLNLLPNSQGKSFKKVIREKHFFFRLDSAQCLWIFMYLQKVWIKSECKFLDVVSRQKKKQLNLL